MTQGVQTKREELQAVEMQAIAAKMQTIWSEIEKTLNGAQILLKSVPRKPEKAAGELRRMGLRVRDSVTVPEWTNLNQDSAEAFLVDRFQTGVKAIAGAMLVAATGLEGHDKALLQLAETASREGSALATAAVMTAVQWNQNPNPQS